MFCMGVLQVTVTIVIGGCLAINVPCCKNLVDLFDGVLATAADDRPIGQSHGDARRVFCGGLVLWFDGSGMRGYVAA